MDTKWNSTDKDPGGALERFVAEEVREAVEAGRIAPSRHASYVRLYEQAKEVPDWKMAKNK